jgi:hypothetical protein
MTLAAPNRHATHTTTNDEETDTLNVRAIDALARGVQAPQGRRFALKSFGLAALAAAAAAPLVTEAGNNGKNKKNKTRKRNRKQGRNGQECPPEDCTAEEQQAAAAICQGQVAKCEQESRVICERQNNNPEGVKLCLDELVPCCTFLGTCDITAFFTCVAPPEDVNPDL